MSSLLSFFRKKKKNETPAGSSNCEIGRDVLGTHLAKPKVESKLCASQSIWLPPPTQQWTNITLVQGSSDSKPGKESVPKCHPSRENSIKNRYVNITPKLKITNVQHLYGASSRAETPQVLTPRLYPSLDPLISEGHSSNISKELMKVEDPHSIHHISGEICFCIQQQILDAVNVQKRLEQLKDDVQKKVLAVKKVIENLPNLEYTFNKELDVQQNYSHVVVYEKLHTFDDVKNYHRRINHPSALNNANNSRTTPIFESYSKKFRCYRAQRNDVVDCD